MNVVVSQIVGNFANAEIVRRRTDGGYVDSVWTETSVADTPLRCVMQPASGAVRDALPEGVRNRAKYVCHIAGATIRIDKAGTGQSNDAVFYRGVQYEALSPWEYMDHGEYNKIVLCTLEA